SEFQSQFQEAMREAELTELKKQVDDMTSQAQSYASFDPVAEVRRELDSTQQQIESAMADKPAPTTSPPATAEGSAAPAIAPTPRVGVRTHQPRPRESRLPPLMSPSPMASQHEPRGRR